MGLPHGSEQQSVGRSQGRPWPEVFGDGEAISTERRLWWSGSMARCTVLLGKDEAAAEDEHEKECGAPGSRRRMAGGAAGSRVGWRIRRVGQELAKVGDWAIAVSLGREISVRGRDDEKVVFVASGTWRKRTQMANLTGKSCSRSVEMGDQRSRWRRAWWRVGGVGDERRLAELGVVPCVRGGEEHERQNKLEAANDAGTGGDRDWGVGGEGPKEMLCKFAGRSILGKKIGTEYRPQSICRWKYWYVLQATAPRCHARCKCPNKSFRLFRLGDRFIQQSCAHFSLFISLSLLTTRVNNIQ
jgi:hypothetical protein